MLRMLIKAYYVNVVVYIQPIYLNKHAFSRLFVIINGNYNILLQRRKSSLRVRLKKV